MASPEGSWSSPDEKKGISTDGVNVKFGEVDLIHYHEQCAGRLVLDPKFVCFFICPLSVVHLAEYAPERRRLNLEARLPRDSSFHRIERLSSGRSHLMTQKTLKMSVCA